MESPPLKESRFGRVRVIDSHTGGEPTRVVLEGGPELGNGTLAERCEIFRREHEAFRSAVVREPRGWEGMVGALLLAPVDPRCAAGVIFFNNAGVLGMCGHGVMGLVITLKHLAHLYPGEHLLETAVGTVGATLHLDGTVSVVNVPAWREAASVVLTLPGGGRVTGDIAWGGNWFFLCAELPCPLGRDRIAELTEYTRSIRLAVNEQGYPEVDHIELFGRSPTPGVQARNFVLCPGLVYDRSPCGTGTSAKLACLAASELLEEGEPWVQESIIGSTFAASYQWVDDTRRRIIPTITGRAHITAESTLLLDEADPLCWGLPGEETVAPGGSLLHRMQPWFQPSRPCPNPKS